MPGFFVSAYALGLGDLRVQSGLGQPLKAHVTLVGTDSLDLAALCIRARVESAEGAVIGPAAISLSQTGQTKSVTLVTRQSIQEPVVKLIIDIQCEVQLHREFLILLDPPEFLALQSKDPLPAFQNGGRTPDLSNKSLTASALAVSPAASAVDSGREPTTSRAGSQKNQTAKKSAVSLASAEAPPKATSVARQTNLRLEKPSKDRLTLSDDNLVMLQALTMKDSLSPVLERQFILNLAELHAAQAQMAAILRGGVADPLATAENVKDRERVVALQNETAKLTKQNKINVAALDELRKNSFSRNWIVVLLGVGLLAVVTILALIFYIRRLHKSNAISWWEPLAENKEAKEAKEANDAIRRRNIEELVDNVQASYDDQLVHAEFASQALQKKSSLGGDSTLANSGVDTISPEKADKFFQSVPTRNATLTLEETNSSVFNFFSSPSSSVNVEEISDVTQEAEFWMSVNDPERAIEILEPQIDLAHPDSPVPWLYLLDLYSVVNNRAKYDSLRDRFIVTFNAIIPQFGEVPATAHVRQLEDFPHLIKHICELWNSPGIVAFLQCLLVDDRDGNRVGFELPVYRDILMLIAVAHELERVRLLEGNHPDSSPSVSHWLNSNEKPGSDLRELDHEMIEFEVIDFLKVAPPEK